MEARRNSGFYISTGCPGCGGMLRLESDFRSTHCEHCQSVVRIKPAATPYAFLLKPKIPRLQVRFHLDRFLKDAGRPLSSQSLEIDGVYAPYWQVEGVLLRLRHRLEKRFETSEWDRGDQVVERQQQTTEVNLAPYSVTFPADSDASCYPASLGVRTQIAFLHPYSEAQIHEDFRPQQLRVSITAAAERARRAAGNLDRLSQVGTKKNQSRLFITRLSVVYMPFFVCKSGGNPEQYIVDAISGDVSEVTSPEGCGDLDTAGATAYPGLQVELHQCPNCGNALHESPSFLQVCAECCKVIDLDGNGLSRQLPLRFQGAFSENATLFPFYVFDIASEHAGRIKQALRAQTELTRLIVPAFTLANFESLYRLSSRITTAAANSKPEPLTQWPTEFAPVTVGTTQACAWAAAVFARATAGKDDALSAVAFNLAADRLSLLFAPFRADGYFYVDDSLGVITFERAAMKD